MNTLLKQRLDETVTQLTEQGQTEVLDFAEFLRARHGRVEDVATGCSLLELCGGLKDSAVFAADPVVIQRRLRDEWH